MKRIIKEGIALFEAESNDKKVREIVENVLDEVKKGGDAAVRSLSEKFDKWSPESFCFQKKRLKKLSVEFRSKL